MGTGGLGLRACSVDQPVKAGTIGSVPTVVVVSSGTSVVVVSFGASVVVVEDVEVLEVLEVGGAGSGCTSRAPISD